MVDLSGIGGTVLNYAKGSAFWGFIIIVAVIVIFFFYGYFNRKKNLKYNCIEFVRYGNGKTGLNLLKAGFMKPRMFMGMIDYGKGTVLRTSDGRKIENGKTTHLHDIFGRKGFFVLRSPQDRRILVPLSKVEIKNLNLLIDIAPGSYVDASVKLYQEAVEETKGTWEKLLPYVAIGLCVLLCIVTIVINMQMTNHTTEKVGDVLIKGCTNAQNVKPSTTAP